MKDDTSSLKHLGKPQTTLNYNEPTADILDTFPNPYPDKEYSIQFITEEFTSLCPVTGQPDFAEIEVNYIPKKLCIESKSLKLYLLAYRQCGSFAETITNKILEDLVQACSPAWMEVKACFVARGGIRMNLRAEHQGDSDKK